MRRLIAGTTLALAGGVVLGLVGSAAPAVATVDPAKAGETAVLKRKDELVALLVAVDDEDDEDTFGIQRVDDTRSRDTSRSRNTGNSRSRADHTNSRFGPKSRDRDRSRGDKTRDWTHDGKGPLKRDWSVNKTNDRSRNDTRRGWRS